MNFIEIRQELARRELARRSPMLFYEHMVWPICEPGKIFKRGWFHEVFDDYLLACYKRQIKRLVVNIQPRIGKSGAFSVAFPCWTWLDDPTLRFIHTSHTYSLSMKLGSDRLAVLQSEAYHSIAPHGALLLNDQKKEIWNHSRGYTYVMNREKVTGMGCNFLIPDDFTAYDEAQSDTVREKANLTFELGLQTRLDNKEEDVIIIVMQRLHSHDLCEYVRDKGFEYLILKTEETENRIITMPYSGKTIQRYEGELLHPEREGRGYVNKLKLSKRLFAVQHQQDTSGDSGEIFSADRFGRYAELPQIEYRILSIDTATTANIGTSSRWCFSLFGSTENSLYKVKNGKLHLLHCYAKEYVYSDGKSALIQYILDNCVNMVLIEEKSSGADLKTDLPEELKKRGIKDVKVEMTIPLVSKLTRAYLSVDFCDLILLSDEEVEAKRSDKTPWFRDWEDEVYGFPAQYDDRPDTLCQVIRWLKFPDVGRSDLPKYKTEKPPGA